MSSTLSSPPPMTDGLKDSRMELWSGTRLRRKLAACDYSGCSEQKPQSGPGASSMEGGVEWKGPETYLINYSDSKV